MVWHRNGTKDCQNLLKCSLYLDIRNKTENGNEKKNYFELIFYKHHDVYKSIVNPYLNQHLKQISYHFHLLELYQSIFKKLLYIFCRKSQKLHSIKTRIFPLTFHFTNKNYQNIRSHTAYQRVLYHYKKSNHQEQP